MGDTAEPEAGEIEEATNTVEGPDSNTSEPAALPSDIPLLGLHAKFYLADVGWNSHIWTGSANGTTAAFERNVEFLVELVGKRSKCGVATLIDRPEEPANGSVSALADLLQPYVITGASELPATAEQEFERQVDRLARQMAGALPVASCEQLPVDDAYRLLIRPTKKVFVSPPIGFLFRVRPISLSEQHFQQIDIANECWANFSHVSLLGLTAFFVVEVTSDENQLHRQFVLNIPLQNAPSNRRERILRDQLSDPQRVLRFLLLLLADNQAADFGELLSSLAGSNGPQEALHGLFESTLLESLLRALDRAPERISQVAQVIQDLRTTPEGAKMLPDNLDAIWLPIWEARGQQLPKPIESAPPPI
jgi:hypothetical protein